MTGRSPHPKERVWSDFAPKTPHYVLSSTLRSVAWAHRRHLRHVAEVHDLKAQPAKDIDLMGGAALVGSLADAGVVDEMHFIVDPLFAGPSKSPFDRLTQRRKAELSSLREVDGGRVHTVYRLQ